MRGQASHRLRIERLLKRGQPPDAPSSDEIQLTDALVRSTLSASERATWTRIRTQLGTDRISISTVRRVLTPEDQDALYRIIQKALDLHTTPDGDPD